MSTCVSTCARTGKGWLTRRRPCSEASASDAEQRKASNSTTSIGQPSPSTLAALGVLRANRSWTRLGSANSCVALIIWRSRTRLETSGKASTERNPPTATGVGARRVVWRREKQCVSIAPRSVEPSRCSSMAERSAVNRSVTGSSPVTGSNHMRE